MSGGDVTAAPGGVRAQDGGVVGVFGKLPAHGDFVRRGGPAAVLSALDRWLDAELGAIVGDGAPLDDVVDALDGARGAFAHDGNAVLAALIASGDGVGRRFPMIATLTGMRAGRDAADRWCAAAAAALAIVRDSGGNADAALAAVAAIIPPAAPADDPAGDTATGWWRAPDPAGHEPGDIGDTGDMDAALPSAVDQDAAGDGAGVPAPDERGEAVEMDMAVAVPRRWWQAGRRAAVVPRDTGRLSRSGEDAADAPASVLPTGAAFCALLAEARP